jgi:chromosome segregation ATPase
VKSDETRDRIEAAIDRIKQGCPTRIDPTMKLSVRAVQKEAGLGDGSLYYYKDLIDQIHRLKHEQSSTKDSRLSMHAAEKATLREKANKERRIKEDYRAQAATLKEQLALAAADHHRLAYTIFERDKEIALLKEKLRNAVKSEIRSIP